MEERNYSKKFANMIKIRMDIKEVKPMDVALELNLNMMKLHQMFDEKVPIIDFETAVKLLDYLGYQVILRKKAKGAMNFEEL